MYGSLRNSSLCVLPWRSRQAPLLTHQYDLYQVSFGNKLQLYYYCRVLFIKMTHIYCSRSILKPVFYKWRYRAVKVTSQINHNMNREKGNYPSVDILGPHYSTVHNQLMSIIITINVKSLFLWSLKAYYCCWVKDKETRQIVLYYPYCPNMTNTPQTGEHFIKTEVALFNIN